MFSVGPPKNFCGYVRHFNVKPMEIARQRVLWETVFLPLVNDCKRCQKDLLVCQVFI